MNNNSTRKVNIGIKKLCRRRLRSMSQKKRLLRLKLYIKCREVMDGYAEEALLSSNEHYKLGFCRVINIFLDNPNC